DAGLEVGRPKPRRRGENGIIDAWHLEGLLVGVEPTEAFVFGDAEVFFPPLGLFGEDVGDGNDLAVDTGDFHGFVKVTARSTPTSSDADDDGPDGLFGLSGKDRREADGCGCGSGGERRTLDELAAVYRCGFAGLMSLHRPFGVWSVFGISAGYLFNPFRHHLSNTSASAPPRAL